MYQPEYIPPVPCPERNHPMLYTAELFQTAPWSLPPVTEPLPQIKKVQEVERQKANQRAKDAKLKKKKKTKRGFLGSVMNVVDETINIAEKGGNMAINAATNAFDQTAWESFRNDFYRQFRMPLEERFWDGFVAHAKNATANITGNIYISDHYVGFSGTKSVTDNGTSVNSKLIFLIPLRNIISIQLGLVSNSSTTELEVNSTRSPTGIIIYTLDGTVCLTYH
eukprot:TRINITY_DN680_c0_g1_i3.p1 TRINITY_DN680_c0_g1~~TRINITY_DN680_c0_g1_i3.p1  ORF type:complete len:232 (-),score=45.84 TRINITY_DN680_c0_g1_i3:268-936(-)